MPRFSYCLKLPRAVSIGFALVVFLLPALSSADDARRILSNPRVVELEQLTEPQTTLLAPRKAALKQLNLDVVYTDSQLFNPSTGRWDKVRLRSYNGDQVDPTAPYVAPTIEVLPGDSVRITLRNRLPSDPSCSSNDHPNIPHCFNGTNLHAHGLWVSPTGNSDNVLISINPGTKFSYVYNIPADHPAGTYWYHSHRHGSTALQVSSGMAGALVVRGDRLPTKSSNGDVDTLLKRRDGASIRERVLVFQQIQYACLDSDGKIKVQKNAAGDVIAWICDSGDIGGIELYKDPAGIGGFGPGDWKRSGRYTSINGQVLPTFLAKAGEVERWRMVHAGVRDTIPVQLYRMNPRAPALNRLAVADNEKFIGANCVGGPIPFYVIARDGLTMSAAKRTEVETLQPGYRSDALVVFPEAGSYCVVNAQVSAAASVTREPTSRRLLGVVEVAPGKKVGDIEAYLTKELVAAARRTMPPVVRQDVMADLQDGLALTHFTPHADITDEEVTGKQVLTFTIDFPGPKFEVSGDPYDPKPYDPNRIDRVFPLGGVDEWTLQSRFVSHPFHIHVNPFQIVKILDPSGKDVSASGAVDNAGDSKDPEYPGLKGVWKDTLWIKSLIPQQAEYPAGVYTIIVRTRYERYIGEYVLHCHILDHEDQGMMQNVLIDLPNAQSHAAHPH